MTAARRIALSLLSALYLVAALATCPPPAPSAPHAAAAGHAGHAAATPERAGEDASADMPCHERTPPAALVAPCPCGCDERPGAAPAGARLGFALLAAAPGAAAPTRPAAFAAPPLGAPDAPPTAIDHVPWPSPAASTPA